MVSARLVGARADCGLPFMAIGALEGAVQASSPEAQHDCCAVISLADQAGPIQSRAIQTPSGKERAEGSVACGSIGTSDVVG